MGRYSVTSERVCLSRISLACAVASIFGSASIFVVYMYAQIDRLREGAMMPRSSKKDDERRAKSNACDESRGQRRVNDAQMRLAAPRGAGAVCLCMIALCAVFTRGLFGVFRRRGPPGRCFGALRT